MFLRHTCRQPRIRLHCSPPFPQRARCAASFACLLTHLLYSLLLTSGFACDLNSAAQVIGSARGPFPRWCSRSTARSPFEDERKAQVNSSMLDTMPVRPAPPAAPHATDTRQLGRRSPCAYPRPPLTVDPSASHARPPSLMLQPPTACAWSTLSQAQISRARPRAASAALRAATRQWTDFDAMAHVHQRGVVPPREVCGSIWSWHSAFWLYPCVGVKIHSIRCGRGSELEKFMYRFLVADFL